MVTEKASPGGSATKIVEQVYDVFDRWIGQNVDEGADEDFDSGRRFVYDGTQIVLALDDTGSLTNRYLWGPLVDQLLADEQFDSAPISPGDVLWALSDHLGTVRDLVDSDGDLVDHVVYDSFGRVVDESAPATDRLFGFTGRAFDAETGLQNNWHRWYDAGTGAWMSEDPIGFAARDPNLHRFVADSPDLLLDSTGLKWWNDGWTDYINPVAYYGWYYDSVYDATLAQFEPGTSHYIGVGATGVFGLVSFLCSFDLQWATDDNGQITWGFTWQVGAGAGLGWGMSGDLLHYGSGDAPTVATGAGWGTQTGLVTPLPIGGSYVTGFDDPGYLLGDTTSTYTGIEVGVGSSVGLGAYSTITYTGAFFGNLGTGRPGEPIHHGYSNTSNGTWSGSGNLYNQGP